MPPGAHKPKESSPQSTIKLPAPRLKSKFSLEEAIARRRSIRRYHAGAITLPELGQLLWAAQGITGAGELRAAPSAGATYPLEIFAVMGNRTAGELPAGVYHYQADSHSLGAHLRGDLRQELARAALDQGFIAEAPVDIVICALYPRTSYTYGRRGERYVHLEVGHSGENIHLQAVALGLATVEVGAFVDEEVSKVLKLKEQIKPLYIMPVGKPL